MQRATSTSISKSRGFFPEQKSQTNFAWKKSSQELVEDDEQEEIIDEQPFKYFSWDLQDLDAHADDNEQEVRQTFRAGTITQNLPIEGWYASSKTEQERTSKTEKKTLNQGFSWNAKSQDLLGDDDGIQQRNLKERKLGEESAGSSSWDENTGASSYESDASRKAITGNASGRLQRSVHQFDLDALRHHKRERLMEYVTPRPVWIRQHSSKSRWRWSKEETEWLRKRFERAKHIQSVTQPHYKKFRFWSSIAADSRARSELQCKVAANNLGLVKSPNLARSFQSTSKNFKMHLVKIIEDVNDTE